eukprot:scaffold1818_cov326-Chaetoceros_neogracile.AAC.1
MQMTRHPIIALLVLASNVSSSSSSSSSSVFTSSPLLGLSSLSPSRIVSCSSFTSGDVGNGGNPRQDTNDRMLGDDLQQQQQQQQNRRTALQQILNHACLISSTSTVGSSLLIPQVAIAAPAAEQQQGEQSSILSSDDHDSSHLPIDSNFVYKSNWKGTALPLLSFTEASSFPQSSYDMGRWPDPILRRPASAVKVNSASTRRKHDSNNNNDNHDNGNSSTNSAIPSISIQKIANKLRRTARINGAVGLAAQQCGIDVSMIFLDEDKYINIHQMNNNKNNSHSNNNFNALNKQQQGILQRDKGGLFLTNPRIIARSSEMEMKVWKEQCLVLPPSFTATVLRDANVQVQYEDLNGETKNISLKEEMARALQHELDHDRGILIVDHVGLDELEAESQIMKSIEEQGHDQRQLMAYDRFIDETKYSHGNNDDNDDTNNGATSNDTRLVSRLREAVVPPANAVEEMETARGRRSADAAAPIPIPSDTVNPCDEDCREKRRIIIEERRAMMKQSKSTGRSEVFELSRQRANLYGTKYQGASCPPGVPCI